MLRGYVRTSRAGDGEEGTVAGQDFGAIGGFGELLDKGVEIGPVEGLALALEDPFQILTIAVTIGQQLVEDEVLGRTKLDRVPFDIDVDRPGECVQQIWGLADAEVDRNPAPVAETDDPRVGGPLGGMWADLLDLWLERIQSGVTSRGSKARAMSTSSVKRWMPQ